MRKVPKNTILAVIMFGIIVAICFIGCVERMIPFGPSGINPVEGVKAKYNVQPDFVVKPMIGGDDYMNWKKY